MEKRYAAAKDIVVLPSAFPVAGYGLLPINAFLLKSREPMLIDTGYGLDSQDFMAALRSTIPLRELKWLWITHTDSDHIGSLRTILEEAPHVRVITNFVGLGMMNLSIPLGPERTYLLNPGEHLSIGDRTLTAVRPPTFDNPSTMGCYDDKSGAFFSADSFGALLPSPVKTATDADPKALQHGQTLWVTIDTPWIHMVDEGAFGKELETVRQMAPEIILSAHLPAAPGRMLGEFIETLRSAPRTARFVGPNQKALESMLKEVTHRQPENVALQA